MWICFLSGVNAAIIFICPLKVNFKAFPARLKSICFNLRESVFIVSGTSGWISLINSIFLNLALNARRLSIY